MRLLRSLSLCEFMQVDKNSFSFFYNLLTIVLLQVRVMHLLEVVQDKESSTLVPTNSFLHAIQHHSSLYHFQRLLSSTGPGEDKILADAFNCVGEGKNWINSPPGGPSRKKCVSDTDLYNNIPSTNWIKIFPCEVAA